MTPEFNPMDPALEQAVMEIRDEAVEDAVVEAAAARVWARIAPSAGVHPHIRNCEDFQALIPGYRAGSLSDARALLLKDHLHQCVACRHVFEGKVVAMPAPKAPRGATSHMFRWALAATVVITASTITWVVMSQQGGGTGRAIVKSLNGTLFVITADGNRLLLENQDLPANVELRTAKDTNAMLELADGSLVEMRERSSLSTTSSATDITVHLGRGSVIVQAAHRRKGHLYVDTTDCRVAVTGTLFGVTAGVKGSRVSVVQGEVHVTQDNTEKVLHAGDQAVTSANLEPESVRDDISWSRNRTQLLKQLDDLRSSLQQIQMPSLRYSSKIIGRLPAATNLFVSIPNLAQYLGDAQSVLDKKLAANPQLRAWWAGRGTHVGAVIDTLRAGSEYLGDEIDIVSFKGANGQMVGPVLLAEWRRDGFAEFLKGKGVPLAVEARQGLLVFGPDRAAVDAAAGALDTGFQNAPFYGRILESYRQGAGLLVCADLSQNGLEPLQGARYFVAEEKQTGGQMVGSATLGFDGPRTGVAAWLADPSPMGSLDYVSPDATAVAAFVVRNPSAILDAALSVRHGTMAAAEQAMTAQQNQGAFDARDDLSASLGGEFAFAVDGAMMPVPSWKLVTEIYDPERFRSSIQKVIESQNRAAEKNGEKPLRTSQEIVDGRTYYMIGAANPSPLLEAHYTFDHGYLIAAPTRALVARALQTKVNGTSIKHSAKFLELTPRDHHANFSVVIYQNLGTTLAPLAALAGAFAPQNAKSQSALQGLSNVKPTLYAVYGEPDRITMTANGDVLGSTMNSLMSGNILGMTGIPLPVGQMFGTPASRTPYPVRK